MLTCCFKAMCRVRSSGHGSSTARKQSNCERRSTKGSCKLSLMRGTLAAKSTVCSDAKLGLSLASRMSRWKLEYSVHSNCMLWAAKRTKDLQWPWEGEWSCLHWNSRLATGSRNTLTLISSADRRLFLKVSESESTRANFWLFGNVSSQKFIGSVLSCTDKNSFRHMLLRENTYRNGYMRLWVAKSCSTKLKYLCLLRERSYFREHGMLSQPTRISNWEQSTSTQRW